MHEHHESSSYLDLDQSSASQVGKGCPAITIMQNRQGLLPVAYHLERYPCDGHNFFAFAAVSPYEQAGPETNVVLLRNKKINKNTGASDQPAVHYPKVYFEVYQKYTQSIPRSAGEGPGLIQDVFRNR